MGKIQGPAVIIGIPSFGMVSTYFMQARVSQQFPLVSSAMDKIVLNKPIAEARNEIVEFALSQNSNYIYWLDDDVIAPADAFLRLYNHQKDIINGVYWSKSNPPMPLVFRGHLKGPYWNWHVGDLLEVDACGNGLTLVKTDVYRKIGEPWYSTEYSSFAGVTETPYNNTEDLYFYWKARKHGYKVWVDTRVQAPHYDKTNDVHYYMPPNAPQAHPAWEAKGKILSPGNKLIADLGSGTQTPYMVDEGQVVTVDIREEVRPDVVADLRRLPMGDETFDIVHSSHTLEHFPYPTVDKVLKEWTRVLKVGGELRIIVPNLRYVGKRLWEDQVHPYDYWVLYGEQDYAKNFHSAGFTPNLLKSLIESLKSPKTKLPIYENVQIKEGNYEGPPSADSWNLAVKATKVRNYEIENITPDDIDPSPGSMQLWPIRLYEDYQVRDMTPEEVLKDIEWLGGGNQNPSPEKPSETVEEKVLTIEPTASGDSIEAKPRRRAAKKETV